MTEPRNFETDLTNIQMGWDAKAAVQSRASQILQMDEDSEEAYDLSLDAENLQEAEAISFDLGWREGEAGQEEWLLRRHVWATIAIHAYRVRRSFWMPIGSTAEQAAEEARRIYHKRHIAAGDVSCAGPSLNFQMAAE